MMHLEKIVSVTQEVRLSLDTVWQRFSTLSPSNTFHCPSSPCSITVLEHVFQNHGPLRVIISSVESKKNLELRYFYTKIDAHRKILALSSNGKRVVIALTPTDEASTTLTISHEIRSHSYFEKEMSFTNTVIQTLVQSIEDQELNLLCK